ncbi:MAG: helix-turn-helix transcriptional regulator [Candidatus Aenigmarchaeota archaeon]|nr:helix-turn-helix transcriptional regulator [Candidatus Aenigmarchaeota archaeon]
MDIKEFVENTENLQKIDVEFIRNNPSSIKFIRILLGLFQSEFGVLCNKEAKRISEYELGVHKPSMKTAKKIVSNKNLATLKKIKNPEEKFATNLRLLTDLRFSGFGKSNIKEWSSSGYKTGYRGAENAPATQQEKEIVDKLRRNHKVHLHATITDEGKKLAPISVDLFIEPNTLVLLRKVITQERQNLIRHACQLALDGFRLKKRNPVMKVYCVFETPKIPKKAEVVLNESMDWWTTSSHEFIDKIG